MSKARPVGIVDIGSNSVRLVVYSGATRNPSVIFNEKVMAGLGKDMNGDGDLSEASQARALAALARFYILLRDMGVVRTRVVATAAVREATNGAAFLKKVKAIGFRPEVLSGREEGEMAGKGVLSSIPDADGIVGDLGGGSLELVEVANGAVGAGLSLPLGVLRLPAIREDGPRAIEARLAALLERSGFVEGRKGRPFYLVGGSWRALARLDMAMNRHPLPVTHLYAMAPGRPAAMQDALDGLGKAEAKALVSLPAARLPTLPNANRLLRSIVDILEPSTLIVSSYGIREGLLYDDLPPSVRRLDPLIEAAREAGRDLGRFAPNGELLDRWIAPVFDESEPGARLRLAACLLADIAWQAHPDFRAERGVDMALHGNWVGIDGPGRVMLAQALSASFGGSEALAQHPAIALCGPDALRQAMMWGLAIRLGQRLSGGVAASLESSRLTRTSKSLVLTLRRGDEALFGEPVERRLRLFAAALGVEPVRDLA